VAGERGTLSRAAVLSRKSSAAAAAGERAARRARTDAVALDRTASAALERRTRELDRMLATLAAHDPQRTLERGYALVEGPAGEPVTSAASAGAQPELTLRLHDGRLTVRPDPSAPPLP
jgi:exodeoxyribonuclease VII large subunit